jgi:Domain of unknown function (DUF4249)
MRKKTGIFYSLVLVVLFGCVERADIELPNQESLLVVYGALCPQDEYVRIQITQSEPLEYADSDELPELDLDETVVTLIGPNGSRVLPYDQVRELYIISADSMPIVAGSTYSLIVDSPGFPQARSTTTIPWPVEDPTAALISNYSTASTSRFYILNAEWGDANGQGDQYLIWAKSNIYGYNKYWYISDSDLDGSRFDLDLTLEGPVDYTDDIGFDVEIMHCSEAFYEYHRTARATSDFGNPFAEPSIVYSNIEGGIGSFAGYNSVIVSTYK